MTIRNYEKPRIRLVDLPGQARDRLQATGLNVLAGTFGCPYKVEPLRELVFVELNHALPDFPEQEIVVVDLRVPEPFGGPKSGQPDSGWVTGQYVEASGGLGLGMPGFGPN